MDQSHRTVYKEELNIEMNVAGLLIKKYQI